jgi:CheY-like chemotaxis protein
VYVCGTPGAVRRRHTARSDVEFRNDFPGDFRAFVAPILLERERPKRVMDMNAEQVTGTILVVDDDDGVRKVLSRWITEMGFVVRSAADADAALVVAGECDVDVALVDVRMPGHDGIWLLDQIRRVHPYVAVALATGLMEMDPMVTLRPGVVGYIVKPFNREDLQKVILRGLAERQRLQAEQRSKPRLLPAGMLEGVVVSRG